MTALVHEVEHATRPERNVLSEDALLRGYGERGDLTAIVVTDPPVEAQACVCGWVIDPGVASEIPAAVFIHNGTRQHLAWRDRQGIA